MWEELFIVSACLIIGVLGFILGKKYQFNRDQKAIDDHTEYLKSTIYHLIAFGVNKGFPFEKVVEQTKEVKKKRPLTQRESLYMSLKEALDKEQYEKCEIVKRRIEVVNDILKNTK